MEMEMEMEKTNDAVPIFCMLLATVSMGTAIFLAGELRDLRVDLDQERALREQAEKIEYNLIRESADDWCSDMLDELWADLSRCEEKDETERPPLGCDACWDAWSNDMEGTCRTMSYEFDYQAEDSILFRSARLLWDDYAAARMKDCESRKLETVQQFDKCLGPAARKKEVNDALDAVFIHHQSKTF